MKLRPVAPCGQHRSPCFVDYADGTGELRDLDIADYPNEERRRELRNRRVNGAAFMSIREAARRLGLTAAEYSSIERGSMEPEDWNAMLCVLFEGPLPPPDEFRLVHQQGSSAYGRRRLR